MRTSEKEISFKEVLIFVWRYIARAPFALTAVILIVLCQEATGVAMPYVLGNFTNYLALHTTDHTMSFSGAFSYLIGVTLLGLGFWICQICAHFTYDYFLKFPAMRDAAIDAFARVQNLSTDWHVNSFAGATVRKITRGMWAVESFMDMFYGTYLPLFFTITGMIALVTYRWHSMGLLLGFGALLYIIASAYLVRTFVAPTQMHAANMDTRVGATLADTLSCNATVKSFGGEHTENKKFFDIMHRWRDAAWRNYRTHNITNLVQAFLMTALKISLFVMTVALWAAGHATVGDMVFVIGVYNVVSADLRNIGERLRTTQRATSDLTDMVIFAHTPIDIPDIPNALPLRITKATITFDHITFKYQNQKDTAYKNFSLTLRAGERVALVGHSGSGKSTFVKLIQRLYDPQSGRILIDNQDIKQVTQESLRQQIALVPQEPILFHRSLAENIAYGNPKATKKQIEQAAKLAHAHDFITKLPQKYATLVGERGVKLSGGERQRVAIARAMLAATPILILDEATSSLDSESEKLIQDALHTLLQDKTAIVIAHRLSTIKSVDRILVFDKGQIVEEGTHAQLLRKKSGLYRRLYELQAGGFITE